MATSSSSLARRHRALRCFFVAAHLGVRVDVVLAWPDDQVRTALGELLLKGGR